MPAKVTPRSAPTAEALYDRNSGKLWLEFPDARSVSLGSAGHAGYARERLKALGLEPAGSWVSSHGTIRSCLVAVPDGWSGPISE